jgi:peroxiredoxin
LASKSPEFERAGVKILAISVDSREESAQLKKDLHLDFPLLSDPDEMVIKRYGLHHDSGGPSASSIARPANLLVDGNGVIRWAMFTENVRVRVHPAELLEAAKGLR